MAKNTGVVQMIGNVGNLNFAKNGQVRVLPPSRPVTAVRTLENNSEFAVQSRATKLIGEAFRSCIMQAKSGDWHNRLSKITRQVMDLDLVNLRGQRGVIDDETSLYEGYDFNAGSTLSSQLYLNETVTVARVTGAVTATLPAFDSRVSIIIPQGCTHYKFVGCAATLDFETGSITKSTFDESPLFGIGQVTTAPTVLDLPQTAAETKPILVGLGIQYFQLVNGDYYPLSNNTFNPFKIVKADSGV